MWYQTLLAMYRRSGNLTKFYEILKYVDLTHCHLPGRDNQKNYALIGIYLQKICRNKSNWDEELSVE